MELDRELLERVFGYKDFREGQAETIQAVLDGKDTFAVLPTGTGKSLCYQYPSYYRNDGITVIISPLLSLMYDQVKQIHARGEKAVVALTSELSKKEKNYVLNNLQSYRFLFLSPEMLFQDNILQRLKQQKISLLVIDEAHCITQWGVDFRPEYYRLDYIKQALYNPQTLALTATVTPAAQQEISKIIFKTTEPAYIITPPNRPNIYYEVKLTNDKEQELVEILSDFQGPGIIYFSSKKQADKTAQFLKEKLHLKVSSYHADLTNLERRMIQDQFLNDQIEILCATTAFGMGVNKKNIRFVIHYHLSQSIEAFMQESGRAGRDGKHALSLVLYTEGDEYLHYNMLEEMKTSFDQLAYIKDLQKVTLKQFNLLQINWLNSLKSMTALKYWQPLVEAKYLEKKRQISQMVAYVKNTQCRREFLLNYFEYFNVKHQDYCCDLTPVTFHNILTKRSEEESTEETFDYLKFINKLFNLEGKIKN